jgi:hypothetical protein
LPTSRRAPPTPEAIRALVEKVTLTPRRKARRNVREAAWRLGTILEWTARRAQKNKTDTSCGQVSVSLVARTGLESATFAF